MVVIASVSEAIPALKVWRIPDGIAAAGSLFARDICAHKSRNAKTAHCAVLRTALLVSQ